LFSLSQLGALALLALALAIVLNLGTPVLAWAQVDAVVEGAGPADEASGPLQDQAAPAATTFGEEVVVVGNRLRPTDETAATTVVDARQFAGEAKTVAELVTTAPGVAVNDYGGLGQLTTVSIRGSSADEVP
jgi:vitamin B12 transporter